MDIMNRSGKISVHKRDGQVEAFDTAKLAGTLGRPLVYSGGDISDARELARAIAIFLVRSKRSVIPSTALFEMGLKALRHIEMGEAAEILDLHHTLRNIRRKLVRIRHADGKLTMWNKSWLVELAMRMWHISRTTGRILAGEIENEIISQDRPEVPREEIIDLLNRRVAEFGLADAVPVGYETASL
jgi:hypothetical protein